MPGLITSGPTSAPATVVAGAVNQRARELRAYKSKTTNISAATTAAVLITDPTIPARLGLILGMIGGTGGGWYLLYGSSQVSSTNYTVGIGVPQAGGVATSVYQDSVFSGPIWALASASTNNTALSLNVTECW